MSSANYRGRDLANVLQCGDMVPDEIERSGVFQPAGYIIVEHDELPHYKLITYKDRRFFSFETASL